MAARKPKPRAGSRPTLFALAERQIVSLYDAGVLSPAVLQHLIAAYAPSGIDWTEDASLRTVDDRTMHEAVVLIMMPGRALRSARKDFMSVVEHLAGKSPSDAGTADAADADDADNADADEPASDDEDLLSRLGGGGGDTRRATSGDAARASPGKRASFNPLVGARAVSTRNKR